MFKGWQPITIQTKEEYEMEKAEAKLRDATELADCIISISTRLAEGREAKQEAIQLKEDNVALAAEVARLLGEVDKYKRRCVDYEAKLNALDPREMEGLKTSCNELLDKQKELYRILGEYEAKDKRQLASLHILEKQNLLCKNEMQRAVQSKSELFALNAEQEKVIEELERELIQWKKTK